MLEVTFGFVASSLAHPQLHGKYYLSFFRQVLPPRASGVASREPRQAGSREHLDVCSALHSCTRKTPALRNRFPKCPDTPRPRDFRLYAPHALRLFRGKVSPTPPSRREGTSGKSVDTSERALSSHWRLKAGRSCVAMPLLA